MTSEYSKEASMRYISLTLLLLRKSKLTRKAKTAHCPGRGMEVVHSFINSLILNRIPPF